MPHISACLDGENRGELKSAPRDAVTPYLAWNIVRYWSVMYVENQPGMGQRDAGKRGIVLPETRQKALDRRCHQVGESVLRKNLLTEYLNDCRNDWND